MKKEFNSLKLSLKSDLKIQGKNDNIEDKQSKRVNHEKQKAHPEHKCNFCSVNIY